MMYLAATSLFVALCALLISLDNARKSHGVVMRLVKVRGFASSDVDQNHGRMFHEFTADIQNRGLPLHDVKVFVSFSALPDFGTFRVHLERMSVEDDSLPMVTTTREFGKGLIARYGMKSYRMTDEARFPGITRLHDCRTQRASLVVTSQGYEVRRWRFGGVIDQLKMAWNRFAFRIMPPRADAKTFRLPPTFESAAYRLQNYADALRNDARDGKLEHEAGGPAISTAPNHPFPTSSIFSEP